MLLHASEARAVTEPIHRRGQSRDPGRRCKDRAGCDMIGCSAGCSRPRYANHQQTHQTAQPSAPFCVDDKPFAALAKLLHFASHFTLEPSILAFSAPVHPRSGRVQTPRLSAITWWSHWHAGCSVMEGWLFATKLPSRRGLPRRCCAGTGW